MIAYAAGLTADTLVDEFFTLQKEGKKVVRGEAVKAIIDYDLFDTNVNGLIGIYLKTDQKTGKHLIYFSEVGEWAELNDIAIERMDPGEVSEDDKAFVDRVRELVITLET